MTLKPLHLLALTALLAVPVQADELPAPKELVTKTWTELPAAYRGCIEERTPNTRITAENWTSRRASARLDELETCAELFENARHDTDQLAQDLANRSATWPT